jgi:hypothetical protein
MRNPDIRPVEALLARQAVDDDDFIDMALDPDDQGRRPIKKSDIFVFEGLVDEFEVPALRKYFNRRIRGDSAEALNLARKEFGQRGFLLKAALLGSMAAKAYQSTENYVMAEALFSTAIRHDLAAKERVDRSIANEGQLHPVLANYPDLEDPFNPKNSLDDFSSRLTMFNILKSHASQRIQVLGWAHVAMMGSLQQDTAYWMNEACRDLNGNYIVEDPTPLLSKRQLVLGVNDRHFDARY